MTQLARRPHFRFLHAVLIVIVTTALCGCSTLAIPPLIYATPIEPKPAQREAFVSYEKRPLQKAFAGCSDGFTGMAWFSDEGSTAVRSAL
jgi:hypothetical protein